MVTNASGCSITSYEWTPTGSWTLISQTGNTVTLRPIGAKSDESAINCKVTFGCGSDRTGTFTPSFNDPVISGTTPVCSSATFTVGNAQGLTINWASSSPGIATVNSSGVVTRIANGEVTISATLPCPVAVTPKNISVGKPYNVLVTYDGVLTPNFCGSLYQTFTTGNHVFTSVASGTSSAPIFSLNSFGSPFVTGTPSGSNYNFSVNTKFGSNIEFTIGSSYSNACGTTSTCTYFTNLNTLISPFPNPSSNEFSLQLEGSEELKSINIYNSRQEQVYSSSTNEKEIAINTTSLPDGIYIIKILNGRKVSTHQLQIKH